MVLFMPPSKDTHTTTKTSSFTVFCKKVSTQKCCASFLTPSKRTLGINILQQGCHNCCFFLCRPVRSRLKRCVHTLKTFSHSTGVSTCHRFVHVPASVSPSWKYVRVSTLKICPCPTALSMCLQMCPHSTGVSASAWQGPNVGISWTWSTGRSCVNLNLQLTRCKFNTSGVFNGSGVSGDQHKWTWEARVTDN